MPQSIPKGLTREHVLKAIADLEAGIDHPFGKSTGYLVVYQGRRYAPKAVVGIAFRRLTGEILHHSKFSGGEAPGQANYELRRLGFTVESKSEQSIGESRGKVWTDEEVGLLLADYFGMLQLDLQGKEYNKAERNRLLREKLDERTKGSVEFKHQNVSAVLLKLGLPYIDGYKPAKHFQQSLVDRVKTHLDSDRALLLGLELASNATPSELPKLGNWNSLFEAPPDGMPHPEDPREPWRLRQGRQIDYAAQEARNRRLGRLGEEFSLELERRRLLTRGRDDLAQRVEWVSDTSGDGVGYDILSFDETDDSERLIEVKTTNQGKYFPFYVTSNEVHCSEATASQYHLYRLFRFTHRPRLYVLHDAISGLCRLDPVSYRAVVASKEAAHDA